MSKLPVSHVVLIETPLYKRPGVGRIGPGSNCLTPYPKGGGGTWTRRHNSHRNILLPRFPSITLQFRQTPIHNTGNCWTLFPEVQLLLLLVHSRPVASVDFNYAAFNSFRALPKLPQPTVTLTKISAVPCPAFV